MNAAHLLDGHSLQVVHPQNVEVAQEDALLQAVVSAAVHDEDVELRVESHLVRIAGDWTLARGLDLGQHHRVLVYEHKACRFATEAAGW